MDKEFEDRKVEVKALDSKVLAVAIEWRTKRNHSRGVSDLWTAYINAVPGKKHDAEWEQAMQHGSRLDEAVARAIFPNWKGEYME